MSLKSKIGIILIILFILLGSANYLIQRFIVYEKFITLERDEAKKDLERCVKALKREIFHLNVVCDDWAAWNDTYDFVVSASKDYIESNFVIETFTDNKINIIYIIDKKGKVVWGNIFNLETEETIKLADFPSDYFPNTHPLISPIYEKIQILTTSVSGILMTKVGPMLISSLPIRTSNNEGPARGFFIMGRFLNDKTVKTLAEQTEVNLRIFPTKGTSLPKALREIPNSLTNESPYMIEEKDDKNLFVYTMYPSIKGKPALLMRAEIPRNISIQGFDTIRYALISGIILAIITMIVILVFLQRTFLKPIIDLTKHVLFIGKSGNFSNRLSTQRNDEIGTLVREFDKMLVKIDGQSSELIKINEKLKKDIIKREKAEKELRESEKKVNRLKRMEAMVLLSGGVAHDLNNILSGIVSYPELFLMDDNLTPKYRKAFETIQKTGQKAAAVVADLLTIARGVATKKEITNLNDIIKEYLRSTEYENLMHFHQDATINASLDSELLNISCSRVHIGKVVMNLVSNAVEAMDNAANIVISTMNRYLDKPIKGYDQVKAGEYAVLSVSDDGPGISKDDLDRIFEPFYTKKIMGRSGTGLGLAVVWNTIQDHHGFIDIETSKKGTTFNVYFPITRDKPSDKQPEHGIEDLKGSGQEILVVDDVASQREIACEMLVMLGYGVKTVSSGEEAIKYLKEHKVDLVLLDMIMDPGINGRETYEMILKINPDQKVIIASGFSETEEVKRVQQLGARQYIKKPYSLKTIAKAVKDELVK